MMRSTPRALPAAHGRRTVVVRAQQQLARPRSPFSVLGVDASASDEQIRKAFRRKCLQLHPDVCKTPQSESAFIETQQAYATLTARRHQLASAAQASHHSSGYDSLLVRTPEEEEEHHARAAAAAAPPPPPPVYYQPVPRPSPQQQGPLATANSEATSAWFRSMSLDEGKARRHAASSPPSSPGRAAPAAPRRQLEREDVYCMDCVADAGSDDDEVAGGRFDYDLVGGSYLHFSGPLAAQPARAVVAAALAAGRRRSPWP